MSDKTKIIYLACPYTHPDPAIRKERFHAATRAAAELIRGGNVVFSPVTMTHPIDLFLAGGGSTLGSAFWVHFDEAFMEFCDEIVVVRLEGWEQSAGIARERKFFEERGRSVRFVDPEPSS